MTVMVRADRDGDGVRLVPVGCFDLPHAAEVAQAIGRAEPALDGCGAADVDLASIERIDGTGAVLLARMIDRLHASGCQPRVDPSGNPEAARLIALYRDRRGTPPAAAPGGRLPLARIGALAWHVPDAVTGALDFTGSCLAAARRAVVTPRSVDWRSLPALVQSIGADGLPVAAAANLLVGLIIGFLGVSQLGRFGATSFVPELVVVAHFRELGPLVTAVVIAGRSGAGLASELATMKVSEEIDALRVMGLDPVSWLVVPRCLALVVTVPVLTWVGDILALAGGLVGTTALTDMTPRAYLLATADAVTANHFLGGLLKTPFLALAIGMVACGQGLAARGGSAAVGARTTSAVVLSIFGVIVLSASFTVLYVFLGV
jgi:phospholipid/cholesterol/gamma-HCH transport system permease protein